MRVAEKEEARRRGDGGTHAVHVRHVAPVGAASEGHLLPLEAGVPGRGEERPVDGRLHQGAASRLAKGMAGHVQAGHYAGDEDQILRLDAPAIQARQPLDEDRAQFARLARVAEYAMLDALPQSLNHRLRRAEVHVRHPHRQDVVVKAVPLDAVRTSPVDNQIERTRHITLLACAAHRDGERRQPLCARRRERASGGAAWPPPPGQHILSRPYTVVRGRTRCRGGQRCWMLRSPFWPCLAPAPRSSRTCAGAATCITYSSR